MTTAQNARRTGQLFSCFARYEIGSTLHPENSLPRMFDRIWRITIYPDHLECQNTSVKYSEVDHVELYAIRPLFDFFQAHDSGVVLVIAIDGKLHRFGMASHSFWRGELPFSAHRETIRSSTFLRMLRNLW